MKNISKVDELIENLSDEIMKLLRDTKYGNVDDVTQLTFALAKLVESRANEKDIIGNS